MESVKLYKENSVEAAFEKAKVEARDFTFKTAGENVMIYPCGFAWVTYKARKNDVFGSILKDRGLMDWDPYEKRFKYWVGEFNQSMSHKEVFAEKFAELLTTVFGVTFSYGSRMD